MLRYQDTHLKSKQVPNVHRMDYKLFWKLILPGLTIENEKE